MSEQTLLGTARIEINHADWSIAETLKNEFTLRAEPIPKEDVAVSQEIKDQLEMHFAPVELVTTVLRYIDLSKLDAGQSTALMILTNRLIDRYNAVLKVAEHKQKHPERFADGNGIYDSYDKERHDAVVEKGAELLPDTPDIGRAIWSDLAGFKVKIQNEFLNNAVDYSAPADTYKDRNPIAYTQARKIRAAILVA